MDISASLCQGWLRGMIGKVLPNSQYLFVQRETDFLIECH